MLQELLGKQQEAKMQKMNEKFQKEQQEKERLRLKELQRQQYFDIQRKNIEEFRLQREATENLLMVRGPMNRGIPRNPSIAQIRQFNKNMAQNSSK